MKRSLKITATSFILFTVITCTNIYGQYSNDSLSRKLVGKWFLINTTPDSLIFNRETNETSIWGDKIEIGEKRRFKDSYFPSCGLDTRGHVDKGNWSLKNGGIFITTIPVCLGVKKHKVVELTENTLILQKIK